MIRIPKNRIALLAAVVLWFVATYMSLAASFSNTTNISVSYSDGILHLSLFSLCLSYLLLNQKAYYPKLFIACILFLFIQIVGLYVANHSGIMITALRMSIWAIGGVALNKYLSRNESTIDFFLKLYAIGIILLAAYSISQFLYIRQDLAYSGGMNEVYRILFGMPLFLLQKKKATRITGVTLLCINALLSVKLTAIIAVAIGLTIYSMVNGHVMGKKIKIGMWILLSILLLWAFFPQINEFLLQNMNVDWSKKLLQADSTGGSGRFEIWANVLAQQEKSNILQWIFGHGYYRTFYDAGASAHNDFMEVLYDFGLVGLGVYLSIYVCLLTRIRYLVIRKSPYAAVLAMSFAMFFITSLFSHFVIVPGLLENVAIVWSVCCLEAAESK